MTLAPRTFCRKLPPTCLLGFAGLLLLLPVLSMLSNQALAEHRWLLISLLASCIALLLYGRLASTPIRASDIHSIEECTQIPPSEMTNIIAGLPDILWLIDYGSRTVTALNTARCGNHPIPDEEDQRLASLFPARVSRLYLEALISLQSQSTPRTLEYLLSSPDGEQYHFEARLLPLDQQSCLAVIREINAIKETEEALLNQQIFLQQIIDTSPCLIFVRDRHGRFLLVNRETQATFGHDLLVQSHLDTHSDAPPLTEGDQEALMRGEPVRLMDFWVDAKGQRHWFDMTKLPIVRGHETYILTSAIDISHIKAAELALDDHSNLIRAIASTLPLPFLLISANKIQFANTAACELLNRGAEQLIEQPIEQLACNWPELIEARSGVLQLTDPDTTIINVTLNEVPGGADRVWLLTLA